VKHGFALFQENCQVCHGPNASGAWLPDLLRSPMLQTADNWKGVVIDGASAPRGMASFAKYLTPKDAEDIRAYVISEAKDMAAGRGRTPWSRRSRLRRRGAGPSAAQVSFRSARGQAPDPRRADRRPLRTGRLGA
jgi:cytochrome c